MSRTGQRIIRRFPKYSAIHDPDNDMRGLIDHGIGKWWDNLEELLFLLVEKRKLVTNVSDEINNDTEEYFLGGLLLDKIGEEYGIYRLPNENNTNYRNRILSNRNKDITVASLKQVISSVLNIGIDKIDVIQPTGFCVGDSVNNEKPILGMQYLRGYFLLKIDDYFDPVLVREAVENNILAGVRFKITNKDGVTV